jgi:hypothetical protein
MASYYTFLSLHVLGATIWAGGDLVLAMTILPSALRQGHRERRKADPFEPLLELGDGWGAPRSSPGCGSPSTSSARPSAVVTLAAVAFVLAGASIRFGGYPVLER